MPVIRLPDGTQKQFDHPVTVADVAASIGAGLAKAAIAGKVNEQLVDTFYTIEHDADIKVITEKDPEGLEIIRHSTAHLLAHAVKQLFPDAQVTIGPVIEDGFYYDFYYPPGFKLEDLPLIEKRMAELVQQDFSVSRKVLTRDQAIQLFKESGELYKVKIIQDIPEDETLSVYQQGDFVDLCRGPHIPRTGMLKAFKLTKVSGAYWKGDSNNEMLQRVYGTAWPDKKSLEAYLHRIEEAEKRDHRKIAKKMDLFHIQEEAPGMIFWHANGWSIYQTIEQYIRESLRTMGYQEVNTPQLVDSSLWQKSGHWEKFGEEMFSVESDNRTYAVKPMNCPCHIQIFNQGLKSYRDLPIRLAEFGSCHRNEIAGALHGLMRVRGFTQDDGHIFCTEDQIAEEIQHFIQQLQQVYHDFGFKPHRIKLSTRPDKRVGADSTWDKAEQALEKVLNQSDLTWTLDAGGGAFYGPKIEFALQDCLGRIWGCGTIQLDFLMPERLGAYYIAEDGSKKIPVMLHRAILGSLERFIGILLEEYAGSLPLWLAPIQAVVMNITDQQVDYTKKMAQTLKNLGFRVITDLRNEKIGFKIREHSIQRVPYLIVCGDKEVTNQTVTIRTQSGQDLGSMPLAEAIALFEREIAKRCRKTEE